MKHILAVWMALLLPFTSIGCDVCGIFLGIQLHDRTSSFSLFWRYRRLEGTLPGTLALGVPKHDGSVKALLPLAKHTTANSTRWPSSVETCGGASALPRSCHCRS